MQRYIDQLCESVTESQATILRTSESEVSRQEGMLRQVREEIERERRGQEVQLRDLRIGKHGTLPLIRNSSSKIVIKILKSVAIMIR